MERGSTGIILATHTGSLPSRPPTIGSGQHRGTARAALVHRRGSDPSDAARRELLQGHGHTLFIRTKQSRHVGE